MEKICQSCAMPLKSQKDYGTNKDGSKNKEYCHFCYQNGRFTSNMTLDQFIEKQVKIAVQILNMSEDKARQMAKITLPKLKRWEK